VQLNNIIFYGSRRANKTKVLLPPSINCAVIPTYGGVWARLSNGCKLAVKIFRSKKRKPELLLTDVGGAPLWLIAMLGKLARIPVVLRLRGDLLEVDRKNHSMICFYFDRFALKRIDKIIPVCDSLQSKLALIGVPEDRMSVVNTPMMLNGTWLPLVERKGDYLLMVTNFHFLDKVKNISNVVQSILNENLDMQFVIAGDGKYQKMVQSMLEPDVMHRVDFVGDVSTERIVALYQHASLFIHVSAFDALPSVIQEALYFGVPVIALETGSVSEMIVHGKNGYVFSDLGDLCNCVVNIFREYQMLEMMVDYAAKGSSRWEVPTLSEEFQSALNLKESA